MLRRLIHTRNELAPAIARLVLGLVMLPHGLQKLFGMFGGPGWDGTIGFMTGMLNVPYPFAVLAILAESLGALALILGFLGRVGAFGIAVNMVVATFMAHLSNGFFMNWSGTQKGEGFEYHLLAIGLAVIVMIAGSGAASVDRALSRRDEPVRSS
ncbi:MAG TPA: DoxX family protein [Longimicrobium sp.]|nr:DoxX family protein [Longimicrobium sp.]